MALPLRLRRCSRTTLASPRLSRLSSSSSSSNGGGGGGGGGENDKNPPPPPPPSSYSSYLSDVKASLRQSPPQKTPTATSRSPVQPSLLSPKPSKMASLYEIRKNLSEFRRRSAASRSLIQPSLLSPKPSKTASLDEISKTLSEFHRRSAAPSQGSSFPPPVSFEDIYNSKLIGKPAEDAAAETKKTTFNSIRESLRQLRSSNSPSPMDRSRGSGTLETLPSAILQKQLESEAASGGIWHERTPSRRTRFAPSVVYIRKGNGGEEGARDAGAQDGIREDV